MWKKKKKKPDIQVMKTGIEKFQVSSLVKQIQFHKTSNRPIFPNLWAQRQDWICAWRFRPDPELPNTHRCCALRRPGRGEGWGDRAGKRRRAGTLRSRRQAAAVRAPRLLHSPKGERLHSGSGDINLEGQRRGLRDRGFTQHTPAW